jgi:hypothetical protein
MPMMNWSRFPFKEPGELEWFQRISGMILMAAVGL